MPRIKVLFGAGIAALALSGLLSTASASAKELILYTNNGGVVDNGTLSWTSTAGSVTFDEPGENPCGTVPPFEFLKWKVTVNKEGNSYIGSVTQSEPLTCSLPGGVVTIEPDPHPWSVKLSPNGKGKIKATMGKMELVATFPDERTCVYGAGKEALSFQIGTGGRPQPLEPGDPVPVIFKLRRNESSPGCFMKMIKNGYMYAVQFVGPEEEPLYVRTN
jgi:hypothetical protein